MPEGHTIHRLARDIGRDLKDHAVAASSPQGRFADGAALLDGRTLTRTEAWGKHLFLDWEGGDVLYVHLGLIGKFRRSASPPPDPVGEIRLRLHNAARAWDLSGPMACTVGPPEMRRAILADVGPDPLRRSGKAEPFVEKLTTTKRAVGAALLDQSLIAGIGNVYRAELLFLAGIHPQTPGTAITEDEAHELWRSTVAQLKQGYRLNRIVTVDPKEVGRSSVARMPDDDRLYVYKRAGEPCRRCGTPIDRIMVANRKTWLCPRCQPTR